MDELKIDYKTFKAYYVYNIVFVMTYDYDKYYKELFKNALKYGMSKNEFWNGQDYDDYFVYEEAYYEKMHETQHIGGLYNFIAISSALGGKTSDGKPLRYPDNNYLYQQKNKAKNAQSNSSLDKGRFKEVKKEKMQELYMSELAHYY